MRLRISDWRFSIVVAAVLAAFACAGAQEGTLNEYQAHATPSATATPPRAIVVRHSDTWEFYQDARGDWRWTRTAPNGRIVGQSSEGYRNRKDCEANARRNGWDEKQKTQKDPGYEKQTKQ